MTIGSKAFAFLYDSVMAIAERGPLSRWRRSVVRQTHGLALEIGAGTGLDLPYYSRDAVVVATDPDVAMLARARKRALKSAAEVLLVAADAEALPFRDATFDAAVSALALCTIPHPGTALGELKRVVRPAGKVAMLEHVRVAHVVLGRIQVWLTPIWKRLAGGCHLDRDTLNTVVASGLIVDGVKGHAGGGLVEITARVSSGSTASHRKPGPNARPLTRRRNQEPFSSCSSSAVRSRSY